MPTRQNGEQLCSPQLEQTDVRNIVHKMTGSKLIFEIDISKAAIAKAQPSSTGRTYLIANSEGKRFLASIDGRECTFNLNVMLAPPEGE